MTTQAFTLDLRRDGDRWSAELTDLDDDRTVAPQRVVGDSPGGVLEQLGQHLDAAEAHRLTRAYGVAQAIADGLSKPAPARPPSLDELGRRLSQAGGLEAELERDDVELKAAVRRANGEGADLIRHAADRLAGAKSSASEVLEGWADLPDVDASSGELEQAVGLLGRVVDDLEAEVDGR